MDDEALLAKFAERIPLGRVCKPEDRVSDRVSRQRRRQLLIIGCELMGRRCRAGRALERLDERRMQRTKRCGCNTHKTTPRLPYDSVDVAVLRSGKCGGSSKHYEVADGNRLFFRS
jgi:hypothetical protein